MSNALIISDSPSMTSALQSHFQVLNWSYNALSVGQPMIKSSQPLDCTCVVMVIDAGFLARYGRVIEEMGQFFKNMAKETSLYLIFENHYDPTFHTWLVGTKRLFQQVANAKKLKSAVMEITQTESGMVISLN